tara:strand:- start:50890 stop:51726 length:837 start_codon:yes stop_codon:yes gene_type:complete
MATITLRSAKGSPLTNTEVDNNFTNLNNDKYESGDNIVAAALTATGNVTLGIATVTAAGSTQSAAQALSKTYNIISTASANQGVKLPDAVAGLVINVYNTSGATIKVYPFSGDTINGGSADAPVDLVTDNGAEYVGTSTGAWRSVGSGGNNVQDFTVNGTAELLGAVKYGIQSATAAGTDQAGATAITETVVVVASGSANNGVVLPTAVAGLTVVVQNSTTADLKLYPNTSDAIDGATANAAKSLPAKTTITVTCNDATNWLSHRSLAIYDASGTLIN